ncbi:MAG: hypothetical protein VW684_15490 [Betaproteobacteria bacterium]
MAKRVITPSAVLEACDRNEIELFEGRIKNSLSDPSLPAQPNSSLGNNKPEGAETASAMNQVLNDPLQGRAACLIVNTEWGTTERLELSETALIRETSAEAFVSLINNESLLNSDTSEIQGRVWVCTSSQQVWIDIGPLADPTDSN